MYILKKKKEIKIFNSNKKNLDVILIQLCNFLVFCLQKLYFSNLSYKMGKKLEIVEMLFKLSLAVCFSKKTKKEMPKKKKNLLLPCTNIFRFQTDGFDSLYDARARKVRFTKYLVGWFMGQRSKKYRNFQNARKYVYFDVLKHIKEIRRKSEEDVQAIKIKQTKRKENILYGMYERFKKKSQKKIKFFERKLFLRMRKRWIDFRLIKIKKNIIKVRKFYLRTRLLDYKKSSKIFFKKKSSRLKLRIDLDIVSSDFKRNLKKIKKNLLSYKLFRKNWFLFNFYLGKPVNKIFFFCKLEKNA